MVRLRGRKAAIEDRKASLIHHALNQLAVNGVQNANLAEILRAAGGSKATLAKYFVNKDGLFAAALAKGVNEIFSAVALTDGGEDDIEKAVTALARGLLQFYIRPESLMFYRSVVSASATQDGQGLLFYTHGHLVVVKEISKHLEKWRGCGLRSDVDVADEASRLCHLVRSGLYERILLRIDPPAPSDAAVDAAAYAAAKTFLYGIASHLPRPDG